MRSQTRGEPAATLSIDIGGTFTDVVVRRGGQQATAKVLTTAKTPDTGVMEGIALALKTAGVVPGDVDLIVHGTTLATNALIQRKGARTALLTTRGFRDVLEIAFEQRFEQYDVFIDRPAPLVPRRLRFEVTERVDARGRVLLGLDEVGLRRTIEDLAEQLIESVAIGFLHSYANDAHERRAAEIVREMLPAATICLSAEVCPEIREYNRFSTVCANAFVQPLMARYLTALRGRLEQAGFGCPVRLMTSGGGLTTFDAAIRFPIRLVESGPAGGAILAATIARQRGLGCVLSFDMGGTTAKICLIEEGAAQSSRELEVAREYRFAKGSGLPLRIPVIEMVEIGAGGGSVARTDAIGRLIVGPDSASSDPGPACYGLGGTEPTVTDADLVLGRIDANRFAAGRLRLSRRPAETALADKLACGLGLSLDLAAAGVSEIVEENMASAARVHAIERGKELGDRTLIAFGGAAPLHAARLAEKLGIRHVIVPASAGVGSAVGFLEAPIAYEVVRSRHARLGSAEPAAIRTLLQGMEAEAMSVVSPAARGAPLEVSRSADMRYIGQGHELSVVLPDGDVDDAFLEEVVRRFTERYEHLYTRSIPGLDIEVLTWAVRVAEKTVAPTCCAAPDMRGVPVAGGAEREIFDPASESRVVAAVVDRRELAKGMCVRGPALIVEDETSTLVPASFVAGVNDLGHIELTAAVPAAEVSRS
jgi:N-methylhydantoinase A